MTMEIRKAERRKARLRLGIVGASGSGKTYTALLLAFGLGGKIGLIDTEHGSGELYAHLGAYDVISLHAPYEAQKYLSAIKAFEDAKYDIIIIDSLTHAWAGEGGLLDKQGTLEASGRYKNAFATWRDITPLHNRLIETMLKSPSHIIGTMRSKQEYVLEKDDRGKSVPRKVGMAPVQRDGMDYEFTVVFDMSDTHYAKASKDRTGLFDSKLFIPSLDTGKQLAAWLNTGKEAPPPPKPQTTEERLGDEIPDFANPDKKPEPMEPPRPTLQQRANTYAEIIKSRLHIEEFDEAVRDHAALMGELNKELPAWGKRLQELIQQKRNEFTDAFAAEAAKPKRKPRAKKDDDMSDPLPDNMLPTQADIVNDKFNEAKEKNLRELSNQTKGD